MKHGNTLSQLARFVLRPGLWDADAEAWSRRLPSDAPGDSVAWFRSEVVSGRAKVCTLERDGARIGFVVFRVEPENELLVMGAFGRAGENLVDVLVPLCGQLARQCECDTIRFHTMRPGLIARALRHGYRVSEIVMRKSVPGPSQSA